MNTDTCFVLQLFIAGGSHNSVQAEANLRRLCRERLADRYRLEVVDVTREPERARESNILMCPTLIKRSPGTEVRVVGNLADTDRVIEALAVEATTP